MAKVVFLQVQEGGGGALVATAVNVSVDGDCVSAAMVLGLS